MRSDTENEVARARTNDGFTPSKATT